MEKSNPFSLLAGRVGYFFISFITITISEAKLIINTSASYTVIRQHPLPRYNIAIDEKIMGATAHPAYVAV
ncbi:hypothetical protein GCM10007096_20570 [Pullulanibacillus pueri]|uniref:Uncharacterized protein n=1 Tax=Pullulanibacillus pueri TaxID=1437324 RepID=A0A8J2ZWX2_9BACL|nr:hypothetical protein GCM10007096_20570 [Pullulanibacillus pueri]